MQHGHGRSVAPESGQYDSLEEAQVKKTGYMDILTQNFPVRLQKQHL
jgi:hypothetical protein